jgi:oxygen-independent coproporphyrinogen-3 oxidase
MLLMGLRLTEGIDLDAMARRFGFAPSAGEIAELVTLGLIERMDDETESDRDLIRGCVGPGMAPAFQSFVRSRLPRIRAVGEGRFVLNELVRRLSLKTEPVAPVINTPAALGP